MKYNMESCVYRPKYTKGDVVKFIRLGENNEPTFIICIVAADTDDDTNLGISHGIAVGKRGDIITTYSTWSFNLLSEKIVKDSFREANVIEYALCKRFLK